MRFYEKIRIPHKDGDGQSNHAYPEESRAAERDQTRVRRRALGEHKSSPQKHGQVSDDSHSAEAENSHSRE